MPLVISIAGSDPGRGAGLQMDARVCWRLGVQFRGVVAVDTVQDDDGLKAVTPRPVDEVVSELRAALAMGADQQGASQYSTPGVAVKTGALGTGAIVDAIAEVFLVESKRHGWDFPLVIDPVRTASKNLGPKLLDDGGWASVKKNLFPLAKVVTPNSDEYGNGASFRLCQAVLLKGGHRDSSTLDIPNPESNVCDELISDNQVFHRVIKPRISGATAIHGTGCALSTALATCLARGNGLVQAVDDASWFLQEWLQEQIDHSNQ